MAFQIISIQHDDVSGKQEIQLPDDLKINDDKVYLKKVGEVIYLIPYNNPWNSLLESLGEFSQDFMTERNQGSNQIRENL